MICASTLAPGTSPINLPTAYGGATTFFAAACLCALSDTLIMQYIYTNALVTNSLLPAGLTVHQMFANLPPFTHELGYVPAFAPSLRLTSGVELRITTMGPMCDSPLDFSFQNILSGEFSMRLASSDNTTGRFDLAFECPTCAFGPQSTLRVVFAAQCQTFLFVAMSIGATGEVSVALTTASNPGIVDTISAPTISAVNVTLQPQLEVLQDKVSGTNVRGYAIPLASATINVVDASTLEAPPATVELTFSWAVNNV